MTKTDNLQIASRAISVFCLIEAACEVTYLPEKFISFHHYSLAVSAGSANSFSSYYQNLDRFSIAFLFMRIAGLIAVAFLFWSCGPWVRRLLLPDATGEDELER